MRLEGRTTLIVRGPETKATMADCPPQGEWLGVRFKPGTFMPLMRSSDLRDRNNVNPAQRHPPVVLAEWIGVGFPRF